MEEDSDTNLPVDRRQAEEASNSKPFYIIVCCLSLSPTELTDHRPARVSKVFGDC